MWPQDWWGLRDSTVSRHPHCPKNILNLLLKTEPVSVGADATVYVWFLGQIYVCKYQTTRCIRSSRDRLGFCAKIKIIFETGNSAHVWLANQTWNTPTTSLLRSLSSSHGHRTDSKPLVKPILCDGRNRTLEQVELGHLNWATSVHKSSSPYVHTVKKTSLK